MSKRLVHLFISAAAAATLLMPAWAWQPPAGAAKPRPAGRGPRAAAPDDNVGFNAIFDGKSLEGWEGEPGFWRVQDGVLTGETTEDRKLKVNTFILWRAGTVADFEFKADFRLTEGANSGVQYRSTNLKEVGPFVLKGYQADMDGKNNYTGMLYEERGRGFVAPRGQVVRMEAGGVPKLMGSPGDSESLKSVIKVGDWNQIHIIAKGNVMVHMINGRVMSLCLDEDAKGRAMEGMLGLQLHVGPPMKVEFKNILLKKM